MDETLQTLGVPSPHKTSLVDGVSLAYDDRGSGVPVICLHATGHGAGDFAPLRERIAGRCRIIRLDWPGQGCSQADHEPASAARYAELLGPFLDSIGVGSAVLLGNSIGGAAALQFAAAHPDRVRALVLANPGGLAPVDALTRSFCRVMAGFFRAGARGARWFAPAFRVYYSRILQQPPARERRREIVAAAYAVAPILAQSWQSFAQPEADLRSLAPRVGCPVWFPWARKDAIIAYRRSRAAVETFPNARVQFFRAGHSAFLEDPDGFAQAFLAFLDSSARPA